MITIIGCYLPIALPYQYIMLLFLRRALQCCRNYTSNKTATHLLLGAV